MGLGRFILCAIAWLIIREVTHRLHEKTGLHLWLLYPAVFLGVGIPFALVAVYFGL
jgi:hypothetical protein